MKVGIFILLSSHCRERGSSGRNLSHYRTMTCFSRRITTRWRALSLQVSLVHHIGSPVSGGKTSHATLLRTHYPIKTHLENKIHQEGFICQFLSKGIHVFGYTPDLPWFAF